MSTLTGDVPIAFDDDAMSTTNDEGLILSSNELEMSENPSVSRSQSTTDLLADLNMDDTPLPDNFDWDLPLSAHSDEFLGDDCNASFTDKVSDVGPSASAPQEGGRHSHLAAISSKVMHSKGAALCPLSKPLPIVHRTLIVQSAKDVSQVVTR